MSRTRLERLSDRIVRWMTGKGAGPAFVHVLRVSGRRTGAPRETPVAVVRHGPQRWLVAQDPKSGWVANVRAAGEGTLDRGGESEPVRLAEVDDVAVAAEVIGRYRRLTGRMTEKFFPSQDDRAEVARHPVFAVAAMATTDVSEWSAAASTPDIADRS